MFKINLSSKDISLLLDIKNYFGGGRITNNKDTKEFVVTDINTIMSVIIPHFNKNPLLTQKAADFKLYVLAANLINTKAHKTLEEIYKVLAIKASINTGLSDKLKQAFPDIMAIPRPVVNNIVIPSGEWVAGFTSGDGSFDVEIIKSKSHKIGFAVRMRFRLTQHIRDKNLFLQLIELFKCGRIENYYQSGQVIDFFLVSFDQINSTIIPFLKKYKIRGKKALDFKDFCLIANLIDQKLHLTEQGLNQIRDIKSKMNSYR